METYSRILILRDLGIICELRDNVTSAKLILIQNCFVSSICMQFSLSLYLISEFYCMYSVVSVKCLTANTVVTVGETYSNVS